MNRRATRIAVSMIVVLAIVAGGLAAYLWPASVKDLDPSLLSGSTGVRVTRDAAGVTFMPTEPFDAGLVFYTGARVAPEAYAAMLRPVAEAGIAVFVPRLPFNFAIFDIGRASGIIAGSSGSARWFVGGHSLGGASAAFFVQRNPEAVEGIIFVASYPGGSADLSGWQGKSLSISASEDGLATPAKFAAAAPLLPRNAVTVFVEGGNHAGFARYGDQKGDRKATLPRQEQERLTASAMIDFILGTRQR